MLLGSLVATRLAACLSSRYMGVSFFFWGPWKGCFFFWFHLKTTPNGVPSKKGTRIRRIHIYIYIMTVHIAIIYVFSVLDHVILPTSSLPELLKSIHFFIFQRSRQWQTRSLDCKLHSRRESPPSKIRPTIPPRPKKTRTETRRQLPGQLLRTQYDPKVTCFPALHVFPPPPAAFRPPKKHRRRGRRRGAPSRCRRRAKCRSRGRRLPRWRSCTRREEWASCSVVCFLFSTFVLGRVSQLFFLGRAYQLLFLGKGLSTFVFGKGSD